MQIFKRGLSLLLSLVFIFSMVPAAAQAEEEAQARVDNSGVTLEGNNSFGALLSEDIQQYRQTDETAGGYNVVGLSFENGVATAEFRTLETAVLMVAVYTEDGMKLLASGKAEVQPEESTVNVTLLGEMPQYFVAAAYLVDIYDYSPLCKAYETVMYTREMQELLASTADDYDQELVLNLDDGAGTSFAVYEESTIVIEAQSGINTVTSVDQEAAVYVIENADERIASLCAGNIFVLPYGQDDLLIVKVASVSVSGTTVTVTGADVELDEVFSHMKLESTGDASDVTVDETTAEEGVVFDGLVQEQSGPPTRGHEGELEQDTFVGFRLVEYKLKGESPSAEASLKINADVGVSTKIKFNYYISATRQFIEFKTDVGMKMSVEVAGKVAGKVGLPKFMVTFYGVSIGFEPELMLEFGGKVEYSLEFYYTIGFSLDSGKGFKNLTTAPRCDSEFKLEASIFFGVDMSPQIEILGGTVAELELEVPIGLELKTTSKENQSNTNDKTIHACNLCIAMELSAKVELAVKMKFFKVFTLESKIISLSVKLSDMYWSLDQNEIGLGNCPYKKHRVTVHVENEQNKNAANVEVIAGWVDKLTEIPMGATNKKGNAAEYLPEGTYTFMVTVDGKKLAKTVLVEQSCKVELNKDSCVDEFILGVIKPDSVEDAGVRASGKCGENVFWLLDQKNRLNFYGSGAMYDWTESQRAPWSSYRYEIKSVVIGEGITNIGNYAFYYSRPSSVTIPETVTAIGEGAFMGCDRLTSVSVPDSVTTIGQQAFACCASLSSVYLPNSITAIEDYLFGWCYMLQSVNIPKGVTRIGDGAFDYCKNLSSLTIPDGVTYIGQYAFCESGITSLTLPCSLTEISPCTFYGSRLISVTIPEGITQIGEQAFLGCLQLASVTIPDSVTYVGGQAFQNCVSLKTVTLPSRLATINGSTFYNCSSLVSVTIPDTVTKIGSYAFSGCSSLEAVTIPSGVTIIEGNTFSYCSSLNAVSILGNGVEINGHAFAYCTSLNDLSFLSRVSIIGYSAFRYCTGLTSVTVPGNVERVDHYAFLECHGLVWAAVDADLGYYMFSNCTNLQTVTLHDGVHYVGEDVFLGCIALKSIKFEGDAPSFGYNCFRGVETTVYYPIGNSSWTTDVMDNYGGAITWVACDAATADSEAAVQPVTTETAEETAPTRKPSTRAVFGGAYGTETTQEYTLKTASFSDLVAGEEYLLLALVSMETAEPLAAANILYVDQGQAGEDGTLVFTYVQRTDTAVSYVMACGASNKNLKDAEIAFPFMTKSQETETVDPVVTYEGQVLTEGVDYTIVGDVDYTAAGTYTCYVRGIRQYAGLAECTYSVMDVTVTEAEDRVAMKLNEDCAAALILEKDLYVDLNGFDLTGTISANGYKIYGMDSTTDSYSCDSVGYFSCTNENGDAIVPAQHINTDSKRYVSVSDENGYSFHRFYLGITHMSLKPTTSGVGYKAVFWGDEMVAANLDSFGFTMCLEGNEPITAELSAEKFVSGKVITLRIDNYDVEHFGETELLASVMLRLSDGTEICTAEQTMTLRGMLGQLNEKHAAFTETQLAAVKDFLSRYPITETWETENLT